MGSRSHLSRNGRRVAWLLLAAAVWAGSALAEEPEEAAPSPWMGVFLGDAVDGGVQVVALVPGGPAQEGGLRRGDVVVRLGELAVSDTSDLERVLRVRQPGEELAVRVLRAGVPLDRRVSLAPRPARRNPLAELLAPVPPAPPSPVAGQIEVVDITPELRKHFGAPPDAGVLITRVGPDTAAARSGIAAGDVVVRMDERPVTVAERVRLELARPRSRGVTVVRGGDTVSIELVPEDRRIVAERVSRRVVAEQEGRLRREIEELERRLEELRRELARLSER